MADPRREQRVAARPNDDEQKQDEREQERAIAQGKNPSLAARLMGSHQNAPVASEVGVQLTEDETEDPPTHAPDGALYIDPMHPEKGVYSLAADPSDVPAPKGETRAGAKADEPKVDVSAPGPSTAPRRA